MASDNPIYEIIDKVLGVQGQITSFEDKVTRLRNHVANSPLLKESIIGEHVSKTMFGQRPVSEGYFRQASKSSVEKAKSLIQNFDINQLGWRTLTDKIKSFNFFGYTQSNIIDSPAHMVLSPFVNGLQGGSLLYNNTNTYINYAGGNVPVLSKIDNLYSYNNRLMAAYSVLTPYGVASPDQIFASKLSISDGMLKDRAAIRSMKALYAKSPFFKGVYRPEIGDYVSNQLFLPRSEYGNIYDQLDTYKASLGNMNQIMATGGRFIPSSMYQEGVRPTAGAAFQALINNRTKYIEGITSSLKQLGVFNTYMFTKPEFLSGDRKKILVSNAAHFSTIHGTRFEEGPATKGLFQVANTAATTSDQFQRMIKKGLNPYAAYQVGSSQPLSNVNLRVGVISFFHEMAERSLLGDGGSLLTDIGSNKLHGTSAFGSVNIKRTSNEFIKAVESSFGVNLGLEKLHGLGGALRSDQTEAIELLSKSSKEFRGMLPLIEREGALLDRVVFTDSGMQLSFRQRVDKIPDAAELIIGTRRTTATRVERTNVFYDIAEKLRGKVDVFMSSSEFYKMHGPEVFVNNFISAIQQEENADAIFKQVFGNDLKTTQVTVNPKKKVVIPHITTLDSAFDAAIHWIKSGASGSAPDQKIRLLKSIHHGLNVTSEELGLGSRILARLGIRRINVFNIAGASRLDFGGDINLMKPLRYTMSNIQTIATGGRIFGFSNAYHNPVIRALLGRSTNSKQWSYAPAKGNKKFKIGRASVGIDPYTNQITVGDRHATRLFSKAALGEHVPESRFVVSLGSIEDSALGSGSRKSLVYGGKTLRKTPMTLSGGGLPKDSLKDTILGIDRDIVFVDLGKTVKYNNNDIRYLPVPLKHLALKERDGAVRTSKGDSLEKLLNVLDQVTGEGDITQSVGDYLTKMTMEMGGKSGRFNKYSTILTHTGSRVRLGPSASGYHGAINFTDPDSLYNIVMSTDQFKDLLTAKSGLMNAKQLEFYREQVMSGNRQFYGLLSVDPMQRAEHAQVVRVILNDNMKRKGFFGHFVVEAHSMLLKMMERDVDRDVAKLLLLNNSMDRQGKIINAGEFEKMIHRQSELAKNYLLFERYNFRKDPTRSAFKRFSSMVMARLEDTIGNFIPMPKSLGYTIARGPSEIMQTIVEGGMLSAKQAGLIDGEMTEGILESAIKPFMGDVGKQRFAYGMQFMQSILQAPVQKATDKEGILVAGKQLLDIAERYKGGMFNANSIIDETEEVIYNSIIKPQGSKQRMFLGTNALLEDEALMSRYGVDKETTKLVLADLQQGAIESLSIEARQRIDKVWEAMQRGQARVMAEILGPGLVIARSLGETPRTIVGAARGKVTEQNASSKVLSAFGGSGNIIGDIAKAVNTAEAKKAFASTAKSFLSGNRGAIGLGFLGGTVAGFGVANILHDDLPNVPQEAPLPRDIDVRRPTDSGPVIQQPQSRIYGTNQVFTSSSNKRSQNFNQIGAYSTKDKSNTNITISDKTAPNSPYLLEMHLKKISKSDYTY